MEIFNTLGEKVRTLTDGELQAGTYNLNFDSSDLPSGIYYARLQNKLVQQVNAMLKK